ncbi:MAG: hypothetical protein J3R72DRAFT_420363 [Linnemannia gamsii]|nr:MAG: hypothetical protein J3R72DRAFT_420363 [Linnemannia gamsii]
MKEYESTPLAMEYPPSETYFLKQHHHADTFEDNDDAAYKDALAKLEAAVIEAGAGVGPGQGAPQLVSRTLSLSQLPLHYILHDGASGQPSSSSFRSAMAAEVDINSGIRNRNEEGLSTTKYDESTNENNSSINSSPVSSNKPFQASISTNTGGSSSPTTVETPDLFPQDASQQQPQWHRPAHATIDVGDGDVDDKAGCRMAGPSGYGVTDSRSSDGRPSENRTSRLFNPSGQDQSQKPQQQQQLQLKQEQELVQGSPRDAEDNRTRISHHHQYQHPHHRQHHHQRVDYIAQTRMDIERRRQMYNSTNHLLQTFPPVAKTPEPDAVFTKTRQSRVFGMLPFGDHHIDAGQDYTSQAFLEDYVSTRGGPINHKIWNTSLSPRTPVLPFGAAIEANRRGAQDCQQQGFKSEEGGSESSARLSRQLPVPSPGHQIHPATEPGPLCGVRRPKFTHLHALYDVPFYGIENIEISSSQCELLTQSNSTKELEVLSDLSQATRVSRSGGNGAGDESRRASLLSKHREHIWSIAHEEEYGSAETTGAAKGDEENEQLQGRFKRTQRMLPIVQLPPMVGAGSTYGSGSGSVDLQRQGARGKNGPETTSRGRGRRATDTTEVDQGSQFEMTNMKTVSSLATLSTNTTSNNSNGVLLLTTDRSRHGHGHGHGYGHRRSSRPPRPPRPVSQGIYGPDSFQESLDNLKEGPERPTGPIQKSLVVTRRHWKTWLCVGMLLAVAIVFPLMLKKKGSSYGDKGIVSAGQGGDNEGDDLVKDGKTTIVKESSGGGGRTIVTKTATPSPSSSKGVKITSPVSTPSTSTSTSSSSATRTLKATVRRSSDASISS